MGQPIELVLRGGSLLDPGKGGPNPGDIAVRGDRIVTIAEAIPSAHGQEVIDVSGALITPGLVDIHGHFCHGLLPLAVRADEVCLPSGVVVAADAGSCGWPSYPGFRDYVMGNSRTRLFAFLNLSSLGLLPSAALLGEFVDPRFVTEDALVRCLRDDRDRLVGIKVRCSRRAVAGESPLRVLRTALEIAEKAGVRVMAHLSDSDAPTSQLLAELRTGDIATHIFHGFPGSILDEKGRLPHEALKAKERGVILDVGHGGIHFDIEVARRAMAQGVWPDTISTDAHCPPPGRVTYDLNGVMSVFLALGMPLEEVITCTTSRAAAALGKDREFGSLSVGAPADLAVLRLEEGAFLYRDNNGHGLEGKTRLRCTLTVSQGRVVYRA